MQAPRNSRLLILAGLSLICLSLVLLVVGSLSRLESPSVREANNEERAINPAPLKEETVVRRDAERDGPQGDDAGDSLRTIVLTLRYSPHPGDPVPHAGAITILRTSEPASPGEVIRKIELPQNGIVQFNTTVQGQLEVKVEGDEFVTFTDLLPPVDSNVEEHTLYLVPMPANITVRARLDSPVSYLRLFLQEAISADAVPLLVGQWKEISRSSNTDYCEASFQVFPFADYHLGFVLRSGLSIKRSIPVERLSPGELRVVEVAVGDPDAHLVTISVDAGACNLPERATGTITLSSANGLLAGGSSKVVLVNGIGSIQMEMPLEYEAHITYGDAHSSPVQFTIAQIEKAKVVGELGGVVEERNGEIKIYPSATHSLALPRTFHGKELHPSQVSQRLSRGRRNMAVTLRNLDADTVEILGLGALSETLRIHGVDYAIDDLRRNAENAIGLTEVKVLVGLYLSQSVPGVLLEVKPDGSSVRYYLESYSSMEMGESAFVLEGRLPIGVSSWDAISLPTGDRVGWGSINVAEEGQRIALRGQ